MVYSSFKIPFNRRQQLCDKESDIYTHVSTLYPHNGEELIAFYHKTQVIEQELMIQ